MRLNEEVDELHQELRRRLLHSKQIVNDSVDGSGRIGEFVAQVVLLIGSNLRRINGRHSLQTINSLPVRCGLATSTFTNNNTEAYGMDGKPSEFVITKDRASGRSLEASVESAYGVFVGEVVRANGEK